MTTNSEAKEAIYSRFVAQFTGVTVDRMAFDNEDFKEPSSGAWVRLVVRLGIRQQTTLGKTGNRRFTTPGKVFVQVYTEANTGTKSGDALAKAAADVFEGVSFDGLSFREANVRETGPDGKLYQHLVEADFDYEEIK